MIKVINCLIYAAISCAVLTLVLGVGHQPWLLIPALIFSLIGLTLCRLEDKIRFSRF